MVRTVKTNIRKTVFNLNIYLIFLRRIPLSSKSKSFQRFSPMPRTRPYRICIRRQVAFAAFCPFLRACQRVKMFFDTLRDFRGKSLFFAAGKGGRWWDVSLCACLLVRCGIKLRRCKDGCAGSIAVPNKCAQKGSYQKFPFSCLQNKIFMILF